MVTSTPLVENASSSICAPHGRIRFGSDVDVCSSLHHDEERACHAGEDSLLREQFAQDWRKTPWDLKEFLCNQEVLAVYHDEVKPITGGVYLCLGLPHPARQRGPG